jgi:Phosphotransferase enzyme family
MSPTERALRAAVTVAGRHGVRCDEPVVLREASNLIVRLDPAPVVARVSTTTGLVRAGDAWFAREVALASHLAAAGAPVVAPSPEIDPGPHHHDGLVLTFWTFVDETDRLLDAAEAGRRLRACHEALMSFAAGLPRWAVLEEAQRMLEDMAAAGALADADAERLRRASVEVRERIERLAPALQPVHGDAHLGNVLNGPDGPLWNDWEDSFLGARAWDLGCLHASARAFGNDPRPVALAHEAYAPDLDDATLDVFVDARRFQGTVWIVRTTFERPDRHERARGLLDWYRARA